MFSKFTNIKIICAAFAATLVFTVSVPHSGYLSFTSEANAGGGHGGGGSMDRIRELANKNPYGKFRLNLRFAPRKSWTIRRTLPTGAGRPLRIRQHHMQKLCTDQQYMASKGFRGIRAVVVETRYGTHVECEAYRDGRRVWYLPRLGDVCRYFTGSSSYTRNGRVGLQCRG